MIQPGQYQKEESRRKLTQVFRYLQALDQLRNPVQRQIHSQLWTMWYRDMPEHPTIVHGDISNNPEEIQADDPISIETSKADDFLLKVRRPELKSCPKPPGELDNWLEPGWQKINGTLKVVASRTEEDEEGQEVVVQFTDDRNRVRLFQEWTQARNKWVKEETSAYKAMDIFEKLYALHSWIERESEQVELILGEGLLDWTHSVNSIHHPILLQRVQLSFDPDIPEFTITNSEKSPELYTALFRSVSEVSGNSISNILKELEKESYHPLGGEETSRFLQRLVTQLSPHGKFIEGEFKREESNFPRIKREPVFFLRKRNLGFSTALESIIEDIPTRKAISTSLSNIVGINTDDSTSSTAGEPKVSTDVNGENEHVLLTKQANAEQLEIAQRLERYGSVLVQGPPGTGKTHTIANLLGHLLAQGKSVLVTSLTAKALKVLRDKVIEPLQPLCVSVLDSCIR
ncbi:AAA domain-containing protein [Effusibacillus consociatus]|uniref:AAA domain-containing protein n=1 Tax=Effusibacillus consociatus TaxID=1117041 RepID=A0ABV9Q0P8_9BACL